MKKNGFTLIELLAVIVILAIIALIATPIILGIINTAREESNKRSIELYASAVKNGIALSQLSTGKAVKPGSYSSSTLPFEVEYDGDVNCTTIEIYEDGTIYIAGCTVNQAEVEYTYGKNKNSADQIIKGKFSSVCNPAEDSEETGTNIGAKYNCKVDTNAPEYTFYVLSVEGNNVNLIMDSNIRIDGTAVDEATLEEGQYGTTPWTSLEYLEENLSQEDYNTGENWNSLGPVTAMKYLQEATKSWSNVNSQEISKFTNQIEEYNDMSEIIIANARLPRLDEVTAVGCKEGDSTCPLWMAEHLENGSYAYWTLISCSFDNYVAYIIDEGAILGLGGIDDPTVAGVRPVITLTI